MKDLALWDLKSKFEKYKNNEVFDCMVAEFLLSDGRYTPQLESTLERYKVKSLEELATKQKQKFSELPELLKLYNDIEIPLIPVLYHMEQTGITLDATSLKNVGEEIEKAIKTTDAIIKNEVGFEINLNSAMQVGNFLSEKAGVPLAKTKTGRYATNENELVKFSQDFPIIKHLLTYRELSKLRSTYVDSLINKVDENGRVHTTYNQVAVSTGRLSSINPNLQNIPVTSHLGLKIKSCFIAPIGRTLLSFDYSQQELRILAHLTGEEKLISAFKENRDIHKTTASQLFKIEYEDVTKEQRMIGKTINFGIIYGMSSYGMSQGLNIPVEESQLFIDTFYTTYPKIKSFYEKYLKDAKTNGYAETLLGRRRYVFEYPGQKFIDSSTRRVLMNYPIQGAAADLIKKAMIQIQKDILDDDPSIHLLLQIHDDLVFEVPDDEKKIKEVINKVRKIMCQVYPLSVPVEVDVKKGSAWGNMEKID